MAVLPGLKSLLEGRTSALLQDLDHDLDVCESLRSKLEVALSDDCPLASREGGYIRDGFDAQLDEYRSLATGGKQWIAKYQADISERVGIPSLKVGFNKVFGYYLEVTHLHRDRIPKEFIRKQTLKNSRALRYAGAQGVRRKGFDRRYSGSRT